MTPRGRSSRRDPTAKPSRTSRRTRPAAGPASSRGAKSERLLTHQMARFRGSSTKTPASARRPRRRRPSAPTTSFQTTSGWRPAPAATRSTPRTAAASTTRGLRASPRAPTRARCMTLPTIQTASAATTPSALAARSSTGATTRGSRGAATRRRRSAQRRSQPPTVPSAARRHAPRCATDDWRGPSNSRAAKPGGFRRRRRLSATPPRRSLDTRCYPFRQPGPRSTAVKKFKAA